MAIYTTRVSPELDLRGVDPILPRSASTSLRASPSPPLKIVRRPETRITCPHDMLGQLRRHIHTLGDRAKERGVAGRCRLRCAIPHIRSTRGTLSRRSRRRAGQSFKDRRLAYNARRCSRRPGGRSLERHDWAPASPTKIARTAVKSPGGERDVSVTTTPGGVRHRCESIAWDGWLSHTNESVIISW